MRSTDWNVSLLKGWMPLLAGGCLLFSLVGCGGANPSIAANPSTNFQPATESDDEKTPPDTQETKQVADEQPDPNAPPPPEEKVTQKAPATEPGDEPAAPEDANPFPRRLDLHQVFERDIFPRDAEWLNTAGPLRLKDLKGKFVILDFWTYCCINCMHILPELKKLERKYPNELVVVGVHSAKFDGEKDTQNIADAILRYEIEHPVVNDSEHQLWNTIGVRSWPTVVMIDPEGHLVYGRPGEFKAEEFIEILEKAIPYYEKKGTLSRQPIRFEMLADRAAKTPLRFPGKILADEAGKRLFISDSNHNRIVIASLDGQLIDTIGSGAIGKQDGSFAEATFDHPQGCGLAGDTLYVADTENHLLRKVDLKTKQVTTISGTGSQAKHPWPGIEDALPGDGLPDRWVGPPKTTALNSPWALLVHDKNLYIAMAGPHQIWKIPLDESEIGPFAGNGREDIVDGPLLPKEPYALGFSSFAQPSGLSTDGKWIYVADSEGSSIRAVPFDPMEEVRTVIGTAELEGGRLFEFGDVDGPRDEAKLQHPLDVVYHNDMIYVADTYNNKIKVVDAKSGAVKTVAGTGKSGKSDTEPSFDEPTGLAYAGGKLYVADTNNSLIRTIDLESGKVSTLAIEGLAPPMVKKTDSAPDFSTAPEVKVAAVSLKPTDKQVTLKVKLDLPIGWKINPLAPASYYVAELDKSAVLAPEALGKKKLTPPAKEFDVVLPVQADGATTVTVSMNYYYCQEEASGLCKVGSVVFRVPLTVASDAADTTATLQHTVEN